MLQLLREYTVLPEPFRLQTQVSPKQPENTLYLIGRAVPVVGRKRVERQPSDAEIRCMLNDAPNGGPADRCRP